MGADAAERGTAAGRLTWATRPRWAWPHPLVARRVPGRRVWLTFDAGPHPTHTPDVLARLDSFGVAAGFFVLGRLAVRFPELLAEAAAAGHAVGNRAFGADPPVGFADAVADVRACRDAIADAGVSDGRRFRPPGGRLALAAWRCGYRLTGFSLDAHDRRCRTADEAYLCGAETAAAARPGDVIRLHDDHGRIGAVLDALLPALADRGLL